MHSCIYLSRQGCGDSESVCPHSWWHFTSLLLPSPQMSFLCRLTLSWASGGASFDKGPGFREVHFWSLVLDALFCKLSFQEPHPQRFSLGGSHFYVKPRVGTWGFWCTWKVENRWCRQTSWSLYSHPREHLASAPACGPWCSTLPDISLGLVPWPMSPGQNHSLH